MIANMGTGQRIGSLWLYWRGMMFRFLNKCYARLFGYFWLPCPVCSKYFGGHEWGCSEFSAIWVEGREHRQGICPSCEAKAERKAYAALQPAQDKEGKDA